MVKFHEIANTCVINAAKQTIHPTHKLPTQLIVASKQTTPKRLGRYKSTKHTHSRDYIHTLIPNTAQIYRSPKWKRNTKHKTREIRKHSMLKHDFLLATPCIAGWNGKDYGILSVAPKQGKDHSLHSGNDAPWSNSMQNANIYNTYCSRASLTSPHCTEQLALILAGSPFDESYHRRKDALEEQRRT